jgi:glutathione S-transferase
MASAASARPPRPAQQHILYDVPVSNYCARVRYILYAKGLVDDGSVALVHPSSLGGLKSEAYTSLNSHSKMPLWHLPEGVNLPGDANDCIYEADAIARYVLAKWSASGPSFTPPTPEAAALSDMAIRVMDTYIFPHQGCMYKAMEADARAAGLSALAAELDVLEGLLSADGPRVVGGNSLTLADASLFPTLIFCAEILPKHFGWADLWATRSKLGAYYKHVTGADPAGVKVFEEMKGGLAAWEADGRWEKLGIADQVVSNPQAFKH